MGRVPGAVAGMGAAGGEAERRAGRRLQESCGVPRCDGGAAAPGGGQEQAPRLQVQVSGSQADATQQGPPLRPQPHVQLRHRLSAVRAHNLLTRGAQHGGF